MEWLSKSHLIRTRLMWLVLTLLLAPCAFGMRSVARVDSQDSIVYLNKFGYLSDGTAKLTFTTISDSAEPNAWIIGCTSTQLDLLEASTSGIKTICDQPEAAACDVKLNLKYSDAAIEPIPISGSGTRFFYVVNCLPARIYGDVEMVFLNPNGEHLDSWNIPLVTIQPVFLALSLVGVVLLFVNFLRWPRESSHLYKLLWASFISDVLFYTVGVIYWRLLSANGLREVYLLALTHGTHVLAQVAQFSLILAIGFGLGIVTPTLTLIQYSSVVLAGAIAASFIFGNLLSLYGLFMAVPFAIAVMFIFAKSVNHNIRFLEATNKTSDSSPRLDRVLSFFAKARVGLVVYLLFFIATIVVAAAALSELRWVYRLVIQSLNLTMLWAIAFGLRLKPKDDTIYLDATKPEDAQNADPEHGTKSSTSPSGRLEETESRSVVILKDSTTLSAVEGQEARSFSGGASESISASFDDMESLNDSPTPSSGPSTSDAEDW
eukprot:TRINITY_DN8942_c0_g1_i1.p1 TRINITY_DN8942_c0_g1~~TRINITY_DN8942_c0_g1_i1.p1  ORF type:complete len:558 (-),score=62.75 TRINITY_DN8942_c0_g1_i1:78-1547(-)